MPEAYSYCADPHVPPFDDARPVAIVDGECALCARSARLIARHDRSGHVRIATAKSALGSALLRHYGLDPDDPASWLYLEEGHAYLEVDGILRIARRLGLLGSALRSLALLPTGARQALYRFVALHRVRLFGREDLCALPDAALRARIVS